MKTAPRNVGRFFVAMGWGGYLFRSLPALLFSRPTNNKKAVA
jgi:hypothetical protein